jgi:hypothetical protein
MLQHSRRLSISVKERALQAGLRGKAIGAARADAGARSQPSQPPVSLMYRYIQRLFGSLALLVAMPAAA